MADYDLGTARGTIELDASGLSRAAAALDLVGNKMLLLGGIAIAAFGYSVKAAADFEEQLSRFSAISDATASDMDKIREKALQLGRDSAYGAGEVTEAFVELAKAGFSVDEILAGVGDAAVELAAAGEIPLAKATDTLAIAIRSFKLEASDAGHVADLLAGVANATLSSVDDLATSFKYAAPVANTLGISIDDLVVALGLFSQVGIKGSTAGTSLRGMFVALTNASGPAKEAMRSIGIITEDGSNIMFDAQGNAKGLGDMFQILKEHTAGLSREQRAGVLSAIFQRRALAAVAEAAIQGKDGFEAIRNEASKTTAHEVMVKKLDNLNGSLKILKASLETAAITLGEQFTPYIKGAADVIRDIVNAFTALPDPIKKLIGFALVFGGSFLVVGGVLAKIGSASIKAYGAFVNLGNAFKIVGGLLSNVISAFTSFGAVLLANPIFLVIAAIALLAAGFYLLYTRSETFRRGVQKIWEALQEAFNWILDNWPLILEILIGPIGWAIAAWTIFGDDIKAIASDVWEAVSGFFENLYNDITKWISEAIQNVISWFERLPGVIAGYLEIALDAIVSFLEQIPYYIGYLLGLALGLFIKFHLEVINTLIDLGTAAIEWLIQFVEDFINSVIDWGTRFLATVISFFSQLPGILLNFFTQAFNFFINFVANMITQAVRLGVSIVFTIIDFFSRLPGIILGFLAEALNIMIDQGSRMVYSMIQAGIGVLDAAWNFFSQLPGRILSAVGDLGSLLWDAGQAIINGLIGGIESVLGGLWDTISGIGGGIVDGLGEFLDFGSPSKVMRKRGDWIVEGLVEGLRRSMPKLKEPVDKIGKKLTDLGSAAEASMAYNASVNGLGTGAAYGGSSGSSVTNTGGTTIIVNNPVPEKASDSIFRSTQKLAYLGVLEDAS